MQLYQSTHIHCLVQINIQLHIYIFTASVIDNSTERETGILTGLQICARICICRNIRDVSIQRHANTCRQSLWCLHNISPKRQQRIYTPYTICRKCIRIYIYIHTYLHRRKDMSMYKTRPIQTSYTEKEINTCTRYKCLCRCLSMADILPPPHPPLVLHIRTFPPSSPLVTYHQQLGDLVVAILRCNVQRGKPVNILRLHIRLVRL